ncbi:putative Ig domain-containing protein [Sphingomonas sp. RB3P16]|uniref:putative Ig domain-containing protein n=1 Tax=Parasphingomonas frigoris TaxID=3096163 RepID=UPI002FC68838
MKIAARVRGRWPVSTMFVRALRGRAHARIGEADIDDAGIAGTPRYPRRARLSATAFAIAAIAAAAGLGATPASASTGCTAVNTGTLTHTANLSDATFQVVKRAVSAGLTVEQFTAGDVIHYSYTISNPNGGVHAYYRPTNAAGGNASSFAFVGTSTNVSTAGDVTTSGSGSVTLPANVTDVFLYSTQQNAGTTATVNWTVSCTPFSTAPTVTALSPTGGPVGGGTAVTLSGTGFTGTTAVSFGAVAATGFTVNSATSITATAPAAAAAGVVNVTATSGGGTSATAVGNQFTYAAPTVTGVSPGALVAGASGSITITGTNFVPGSTSVTVGGTPATGVSCASATSCTATAPARSAGVYDVVVTTGSVASATSAADQLVYVSAPSVAAAFSPGSITTAQTATLTVTLTNNNVGTALTGVALATSTLPAGLTLSGSGTTCSGTLSATSTAFALSGTGLAAGASCTVTGTVTPSGGAASYPLTTGAISATGPTALSGTTASATLTVTPTPLSTTQAAATVTGTVGTALAAVTPVTASGGTTPYSFALSGGTLPTGLSFSTTTGQLAGTPSTALATTTFTVTATDAATPTAQTSAKTFQLTIAQATQTISFAALANASLSASPLTLAATASSGLAVAFSSATIGVCTVAGSSVTLLATGTCTINADQAGNADIATAAQVQRSFTVTPASLTVTPGAVSGASVGASYSQANPAAGGTAPYSYTLASGALPAGTTLGASTGTVTGVPTTAGAFSYAIQASDSQGVPATATGATVSGTIAQATQTISFAALANASLSASPLTLAATASSGLAVAFSSTTTGVCTVAGSSVTLLTTGTCTITADQPGNANVAAATQVQRSFTVTPASLTVTPGAVSGASVGASYSQANPAAGGTAPYSYTLARGALPAGTTLGASTGTVTGVPTNAGAFSYAIQATDSQGVPATATGATVSGTIAQATQTISFAALANASLSASPLTLAATASSGLVVTFSSTTTGVCTVAGSSVTLLTTGTCTITADQPGNANVAAATQVQRSFTVTPASLTITPGAVSGASVGASYSQANPAAGGTAPYSYTLASGALPAGTTLGASTGTVTGVPTTAGAFSYAIQATDSQGVPATATGATVSGTIAQATQTISFAALANASLSASPLTLAATASSGLVVTFSSTTTGVCTVAGSSVTLLTTGTCTITADQPGNANVAAATQVQRSFTVTPASLTITPGAVSGASVGASYSQANPAAGGTAPYSYTLASGALPAGTTLGASTGTVTGMPTTAGAFSYAIQATDSQGVPATATGATVSGTIAQTTQTISFAALANASLSASSLTLAATASSGLVVTFSSTTTGVCTVAGSSVTLLTTGTCTITADQPGDANVAAAPQVQRSFTITPASLTVTPGAVSGASVGGSYSQANPAAGGTAPYSYTLASGALPAGTTLGASTGTVTGVPTTAGAFSYAIQATDSQGVPATATGATVSGTIAQASQTISFAAIANASLSASPLTLAATASSGLVVTFSSTTTGVCTVAGSSVTLLTTGTCTITADQPGNANVAAATQVQRSFTVTPASLTVTPGAVSGASVGGSYSQANPAAGGTAPYSYTLAAGALPAGTTLGASTGTVTGVPTTAGAFSYAIQATDSQGVPATATSATVSGTIAQATQTISFAALANASLSASPLTLAATASSGLVVTFSSTTTGVCTVAGSSVTLLTPGTCTITADQPGNANVAAATQVQRSFTVTPASLTITPGAVSGASVGGSYSQANPAAGGTAPYSYTLASGALPAGTTLGASTGTVTGVPTTAGAFSYAIQATDSQGVPATATGATVSGTIAQATQTISFAALANASLSASPLTLAATASSGLAVAFSSTTTGVCTVAGSSVTLLTTGTCTITADQPGNANVAAATQVQRSFTVTPASLTVTPGAVSGASVGASYSQANPAAGGTAPYSYTLASGALPAGTTLGASTGMVTGMPTTAGAFSYAIQATDSQGVPATATGATVSGTIAQATQTISFAALANASLSASPLTLAATASSGLVVTFSSTTTGVCTVVGSSVTLLTTGTCTITADQPGNANVAAATQVQRSFTVTPASLTVTPGAVSGASVGGSYSQANPAAGGTAPYSYTLASGALPAGTTLGASTGTVTGAPTTASAFSYAIQASDSQGVPATAISATVSGTIAQATQTISFAALANASLSASPLTLAATASSGLAVTFSSTTTGVCTVAGSSVTLLTPGTCTITADQPGNANVAAATQVQRSFTVNPASLTITPGAVSGASVGASYSQANPAAGGTAPYSYTLAAGALPAGTTLGASTGTVTGMPTTAGAFSYAIQATDSQGVHATATSATVSGTIAQATQTISFAALANASLSASPLTLAATASSGLVVTFSSTTTGVCTVVGSSITLLTPGTCTITADQPGNADIAAAAQVQRSFTVTPASLTVTPGAVSGASVGASYSQANPAAGGTAPYSYTLASGALPAGTTLGASTGTVTGVPTTAGAFSYAIQATDSQGVPATATGATVSGTIAQATQTISFAALANASLSASPLTLAATASSGLAVAFSSATTGVCTVAGSSVTLLTTGTCTITADQPGNANVAAATQVQRSFTVTPASLTVTPGAVSGASVGASYSQANPAAGGTAPYSYMLASGALPAGTTLGASTGTVTGVPTTAGAFSYAIQATDSQGVPATATGATVSGTIGQATQTISFTALSNASLSASPLTLAATASSGLAVAFSSATTGVCTVAGSSVTLLTTGTCTITADQPGNANVAAATQVQRSFTVTPASLTITPGAVSGASVGASYSQANPAAGGTAPYSYTLASGALPAGTTLGASTGTVTGVPTTAGAFSYAIQATDSQGVPATAISATVSGTIAQATQTISFAALANASLSASPLTLAATASSGLAVAFSSATTGVCTVAGSSVTLLTTGTCTITADQPGNANVAAATQVQRSFTVTPASLTITPGAVSGASVGASYSQANPAAGGTAPYSYTLASGALPAGTTLGASTGTVTGVPTTAGAFSYAIQATDSQGVPATATGATVSGTIAQTTQTISFAALANASLSASPLTLAATASSGLVVTFSSTTTGVCTVAGSSVTLLTPGTCTITADQPGNANVAAAAQVQRSFTVTPASLTVTPGAVSGASVGASYSQANPAAGGTAPYSFTLASGALPAGTTLGASTGTVTGVPTTAGAFSYAIQATDSQGVPATATGATVSGTIDQATQTISFAALADASLSASPLTLAATASSGLVVAFSSATIGVCTVAGSSVTLLTSGTCTITADQPGDADVAPAPQAQRTFTVSASAPVVADRNGVTIGYDSTGTPIDLATSVSGTFSSLSIASPPTHGTASLAGTVITYTPTTGYFGPDSFTVTATGPGGTSPTGTVRLTIATPAPPITTPLAQTVPVTKTVDAQGAEINLSDHVTGMFSTIEISQAPQNGTILLTSSPALSPRRSTLAAATVQAVAAPIIAVYTPRLGYVGTDLFQFVAVGPGGRSAPGTVSLTIIGTRPTARPKQAAVGDGQTVLVDLTGDATEGPFTGAALASVSPAEAASIAVIEAGPVGNRTYQLSITPKPRFGGTIAIGYTLTNVSGTSDAAIVTVTVTARPDPSADPTVRAISDAQSETTRRFAQAQIGNFMRRNEQLHSPASGRGDPLGFRFTSRDGRRGAFGNRFDQNDLDVLDRFSGGNASRSAEIGGFSTFGEQGGGSWGNESIGGGGRQGLTNGAPGIGAGGVRSNAAPAFGAAADGANGRPVGGLALWTGGALEIGTLDATTRRSKITASTAGLSGGVDMRIGDTLTLGIGGGYGADLSEINGAAGRVRSDTSAVAAYGSALPVPGVFVDGVFGYGGLKFSTRRAVGNGFATAERDGSMWFGALSAGIDRDSGTLQWSVYGNLQWLDAKLGSYVEVGAGRLNLRFDERRVTSLSSVLGGRIGIVRKLSFGSVAPHVRGEWQHEFNGGSVQRLDYADIPDASQYGISTIGWRRDVFTLSLGSRWMLPRDWGFDLELGVRAGSGQTSGQLRGQITKKF